MSGIEIAREEIAYLKPRYIETKGWEMKVVEGDSRLDLLVAMRHKCHPERRYLLRLRFSDQYPQRQPEEAFLNPDNPVEEGIQFWPEDRGVLPNMAFHTNRQPPRICIPGTYGYHTEIHPGSDWTKARILTTLLMIQGRINEIP